VDQLGRLLAGAGHKPNSLRAGSKKTIKPSPEVVPVFVEVQVAVPRLMLAFRQLSGSSTPHHH